MFILLYFEKVYDGWNTNGLVLYDGKPSNNVVQDKEVIFSITNKILNLKPPDVINKYRAFYWNVSILSKVRNRCSYIGVVAILN